MSDHLKVDLSLIRTTGEGLGRIKEALERADATNPGPDVLGPGELAQVMDEFVKNWKIHRDKLVSAVEAHQKMALDSADAYEHTDSELAQELTKHSSPTAGRTAS